MDTNIIYSLKSGKWKEISHFPCALLLYDGKLLNGSFHWVAGDYSTSLDSWKIISLDLAKETYGEILQPEYGESRGQTCWMSIVKEVKVLKGRGVNVWDFIRLKLRGMESLLVLGMKMVMTEAFN
ncbi:hypothetical protein Tco_1153481 [Tanacetum coccineum]